MGELKAKKGLLWQDGEFIYLPRADWIAHERGFMSAEQLVEHLEKKEEIETLAKHSKQN